MRARFLTFTAIFIPVYTLYLKTMPPTVFWQDSGIFLAGVKMLGIIYPPGFPLYIVLGALWTKIFSILTFIPLNFAQQVHAFSGLWGAGAAALVGLSVYELVSSFDSAAAGGGRGGPPSSARRSRLRPRTSDGGEARPALPAGRQDPPRIIVSLIAGLTAGFSYSLWAQSINAEVYSMFGFFSALMLFITVKMILQWPKNHLTSYNFTQLSKRVRKYLFYLSAIWGLSFGAHLSSIIFFLPFLYLSFALGFSPFIRVWIEEKRAYQNLVPLKTWLLAGLIFLFFALAPYLFLPLRSAQDPLLLWSPIDSPRAFLEHITGTVYRQSEGAIQAADLEKLQSYPLLIFQEFYPLGLLLGLFGWLTILKSPAPKQKHLAVFGLIYAVLIYLLISFYQRGTEYNFWLIPFYLYFSILIGIGMWWLVKKLTVIARSPFGDRGDLSEIASPRHLGGARNDNLSKFPLWSFCVKFFLISFLALGIWGPQLWANWPLLNRSNYTLAEEFGKNLIGKLPPNAIFFTLGDQESAIPMYLRLVENYRTDVLVLADSDLIFGWKRGRLSKFHPNLALPRFEKEGNLTPEETVTAINEFIKVNLPQRKVFVITKNYLPLEAPYYLIPAGTIWQITSEENPEIDLAFWQYTFSDPNRYQKPERPEFSRKKTSFVDGQAIETYQRAPYFDEARVFELQAKKNLGDLCYRAYKEKRVIPVKNLSGEGEVWQDDKLIQCTISSYEAMFEIDPGFYHREVFLNLAEIYKKMGKEIEAEDLIKKTEEKR